MIEFKRGNLLEAKAEALVNTVNTVGVMGKGVALMFKEAFPDGARQVWVRRRLEPGGKIGRLTDNRLFLGRPCPDQVADDYQPSHNTDTNLQRRAGTRRELWNLLDKIQSSPNQL